MKQISLILGLIMAWCSFAASADNVDLLKASSRTSSKYGFSWQDFSFDIRVDNLAYSKNVAIYYLDSDGQWKEHAAVYARPIDGNQEIWQAGWSRSLNDPYQSNPPLDMEFVVKYEVAGQTYWDNNNGANYHLNANSGELITGEVYADGAFASAPYTVNYNGNSSAISGYFQVGVLLKNLGYSKEVKVHYSYDNWQTTYVANAMFQPGRMQGYSYVTYPNPNGVEYWYFYTSGAEAQNHDASQVKFAVSYTVNGVTYWDNNFGQNYSVDIANR